MQIFGFGVGQSYASSSYVGTAMMIGNTSQSSALLVSTDGKRTLRRELRVVAAIGGNSFCVDMDDI